MWTSLETLRKVLPWNNATPGNGSYRRPFRRHSRLRLPFCLLLLLSTILPAQQTEGRAILLQGPNLIRGVPALGANAFEAQRARYELSSGEEVELYLVSLLVPSVDAWGSFDCPALSGPGVTLNSRQGTASRVYAYRSDNEGRTVLLVGGADPARACDFLSAFLEELAFFSSALGESPLLPFPGVLTY